MFSILHRKKLDVFVLNQLERLCPEVTVHDSFYLERDIAGKVSEVYSWELDDLFNRLAGLESGGSVTTSVLRNPECVATNRSRGRP